MLHFHTFLAVVTYGVVGNYCGKGGGAMTCKKYLKNSVSYCMFQGYTDCGFHGGDQIPTPHIDYLAHNGIILDNYYTPKICTPSRAAVLTGRHPMQLGLQRSVIFASHPWGLGLNETIFPQYLKKFGYVTHAIGKV